MPLLIFKKLIQKWIQTQKDTIKLQFWKYVFLEFDPYKGFQDILASAALIITILSPNMMKLLEYPFCSKPQWVNTQ